MKFVTTTLWISAATCLLGWFLFGSEATSVLETSLARTRDEVGSKLSHEFRVDQAELQLKSADEEIARQEKRVAELRVQCRELSDEVDDLRAKVDSGETEFVQLDEVRRVQAALDRLGRPARRARTRRPGDGNGVAVGSYTAAGLLGMSGAALLLQSQSQRADIRSGLETGTMSDADAESATAASNRNLYLGYGGLGLGAAMALGTRFIWTAGAASGAVTIGVGGSW